MAADNTQIDPETGLPVFDPATQGTTLTSNPFRGFGASAAVPMRGTRPTLPGLPSINPISSAQGPGAPTSLWQQRPSGQPGNGPPLLGGVDSPGGAFGGGAQPGAGPNGVGYGGGSPTEQPLSSGGPWHAGTAGGPAVPGPDGTPQTGGPWDGIKSFFRTLGSGPAVGPGGALPMGSGMSPAMAPAGEHHARSRVRR